MVAAYRHNVITGPLIARILIPSAAMPGAAPVAEQFGPVREGLQ